MAYIGKTPTIGNFQVCDAISVVNGQAAYTMQVGGVNVSPESSNHMLVSLNGILQRSGSSFTVSGSTITFASNLVTGDVIDFIQILGNVLDLGVPSDNTVSLAKLTATGTKDATTFLRGDNTFAEVPAGGITEADQWRITADHSGVSDITANWERVDTDSFNYIGTGMSESSGIFTFPSTGIYHITFNASCYITGGGSDFVNGSILTTSNNSSYSSAASAYLSTTGQYHYQSLSTGFIFDVTSISTHKCKFSIVQNSANTPYFVGDSTNNFTFATFIRLGDT